MSYVPDLLLFLFIINLGTAFGAGLYETKIILPRWFPKTATSSYSINVDAMRQTDVGRSFWAFVSTGPLTLLTLANLVVAWQSAPPKHDWWLAATLLTLVERLSTFTFFIPTAIRFQKADVQPIANPRRLVQAWIRLNYVRLALNLTAWLLTLEALSV
ncbi:anthrone oxygenase family protein [Spirosoma sp. KUDC1026]|uniref:anthrone oxygenase family protein n=1 Tax=Spirosoma sp. KUDC1026 TaxID=2745947 RepID=UPI00159BBE91|nr:DUF1772 domain-containing protein [Spirosoma sp. KUDC1026]QKZ15346.1 DUF1772 domain-containing protein [Spirosoma sp. KUDC1026]